MTVSTYLSPEGVVTVWFTVAPLLLEVWAVVGAFVGLAPTVADALTEAVESSSPHATERNASAASAAMRVPRKSIRCIVRA